MQQIRNYGHQVDRPDVDDLIFESNTDSTSTK